MTAAPVLMIQGTASSVGKSVLTAAFCRILRQDGFRVAPFKAQNMSNNADVTPDGLEIGRAQSEQAAAAGVAPRVEMNPVLIKPQGDRTAQLVLDGRPAGTLHARDYLQRRERCWPSVQRALATLRAEYDIVVAEGAGSPAEPNLRDADIVNMALALHAAAGGEAAVLLVGDIDRGGVFAHLLGTMSLFSDDERRLVRGFLINRFRGDESLLQPALDDLEARTGVPVLGVVPWIDRLGLAEEDGVALERPPAPAAAGDDQAEIDIAVLRLPRVANFDDFDPLAAEPGVRLRYVDDPAALGRPHCVILPGTKATIADLRFLRERGLDQALRRHAAAGGAVLGVCGGFQMLGQTISDPDGVEAPAGSRIEGLGLLPLSTRFESAKRTERVAGRVVASAGPWARAAGAPVQGYEIHMGCSDADCSPFAQLQSGPDGAVSADGRIAGTYLHGLFHNDQLRRALLAGLGRAVPPGRAGPSALDARDAAFDRLADIVRSRIDLDRVTALFPSLQRSGS